MAGAERSVEKIVDAVLASSRPRWSPCRRHPSRAQKESELDRPVHTLSKGNRQKVGVILAFMHRPDTRGLIGITVGVTLLGIDFGVLAMYVGAVTGSRGSALGITSALAAASYLISSLAPAVHWLHPARDVSPFFYAVGDGQLDHGLHLASAAVLAGAAAALLLAAITAFDRLDVH